MSAADLVRRALGYGQANQLVRFAPVLELLHSFAPSGATALDVGSGSRGIAALLPRSWEVTVLDADFRDYGAADGAGLRHARAILGDVRAMPFEDSSFDVVVAIDLLEHVPADDRDRAITEICRVARERVVIACPVGAAAFAADRRIAARLAERRRPLPVWLEEHLRHGFPDVDGLLRAVRGFGSPRIYGNENIRAHERLVLAELAPASALALRLLCFPVARLLRGSLLRPLATTFARTLGGGDRTPTYRVIVDVEIGRVDSRHNSEYSMDSALAGHGRAPQTKR
jgi:SAM-dependent methyltransferase